MKKSILILLAFAFYVVSCNNSGQKQNNAAQDNKEVVAGTMVFDADTLYAIAETFIDKPVTVKGFVTHTCKHSGKKCFLTGEGQKHSIRVEATGEITGFDKELVGSQLVVNGILRERRLTDAEIAEMEVDVNTRMKEEDSATESCEAELANINEMKEWMKSQGKDYYSIYFIDGLSYEEVDN